MFEVPTAKRLKRSELFESDGEFEPLSSATRSLDSPDEEGLSKIPEYGFEYNFIDQPLSSPVAAKTTQPEHETYQFNLFKPSLKKQSTKSETQDKPQVTQPESQPRTNLISIRSPSPPVASLDNTHPSSIPRPLSHHFTASLPLSTQTRLHSNYVQAAISGHAIIRLSRHQPWPGSALPRRVIHLPAHAKQQVIVIHDPSNSGNGVKAATSHQVREAGSRSARTRPSKKARDRLKQRAVKRQAVIDASKSKEEHEREKKNRKNRERKVKRRAKERKDKEEARAKGEDEVHE